jgi:hypothetical protein
MAVNWTSRNWKRPHPRILRSRELGDEEIRAGGMSVARNSNARARILVRSSGFEPPRYCYRQPLKLVRLPIPPRPHSDEDETKYSRSRYFLGAGFCAGCWLGAGCC